MIKNPPAKAGDKGSIPGPGRSHRSRSNYAHTPQLSSLESRAGKPQTAEVYVLEPVLCNERIQCNEKPAHC